MHLGTLFPKNHAQYFTHHIINQGISIPPRVTATFFPQTARAAGLLAYWLAGWPASCRSRGGTQRAYCVMERTGTYVCDVNACGESIKSRITHRKNEMVFRRKVEVSFRCSSRVGRRAGGELGGGGQRGAENVETCTEACIRPRSDEFRYLVPGDLRRRPPSGGWTEVIAPSVQTPPCFSWSDEIADDSF